MSLFHFCRMLILRFEVSRYSDWLYGPDYRGIGVRVRVGSRIFSTSFRSAVGPTQLDIQWALGTWEPEVHHRVRKVPPLNQRNEAHNCTLNLGIFYINVYVFQEALFYLDAFRPKCALPQIIAEESHCYIQLRREFCTHLSRLDL
jgi:hypothetical protein